MQTPRRKRYFVCLTSPSKKQNRTLVVNGATSWLTRRTAAKHAAKWSALPAKHTWGWTASVEEV